MLYYKQTSFLMDMVYLSSSSFKGLIYVSVVASPSHKVAIDKGVFSMSVLQEANMNGGSCEVYERLPTQLSHSRTLILEKKYQI